MSATVDIAPPASLWGAGGCRSGLSRTDSSHAARGNLGSAAAACLPMSPANKAAPTDHRALPSLDAALRGLPRGKLVEPRRWGREAVVYSADPRRRHAARRAMRLSMSKMGWTLQTAARVGVTLEQVLWIRPRSEKSEPAASLPMPRAEPGEYP